MDYTILYYGSFFISIIITLIAQAYVNINYKRYLKITSKKNITGFEIARKILDNHNLKNILILETRGNLTDHYDPKRKVIKLSQTIYNGTSIASIAVAAHECGHAIQDKENYKYLKFRNFLVPFVNLSSKLGYIIIFIGIFAKAFNLSIFGIILLCTLLLFQLITLPVEFNASNRAKSELIKLNISSTNDEKDGVKNMLRAAAYTYIASLATNFIEILRLLLIVINNRDRN